jgi:hypothetical protein
MASEIGFCAINVREVRDLVGLTSLSVNGNACAVLQANGEPIH